MDKYILREFLTPLFYIIAGFSMITIVFDLFGHLSHFLDTKAPIWLVVRYYLCIFLQTLEYTLPASLLFATLYTQWLMAKNNELTAMRASGVSFSRIMVPYLAVAFTLSVISAVLKETVIPFTNQWAETLSENKFKIPKHQLQRNLAYYNSTDNREWLIDAIDLNMPGTLTGVRVKLERKDNICFEEIAAKKARWLDGQWWFFKGHRQPYNNEGIPDKGKTPIPLNPAGEIIPELTETPSDFVNEIKPWEYLTSLEMMDYLHKHPQISKEAIANKKTDFHAHLALPWACLLVTLFGIPVGARGSKQNPLAGIFLAVVFFLGFYFLTHFGIFCGKKHIVLPWIGAWFSNIVSAVIGITMIIRMK